MNSLIKIEFPKPDLVIRQREQDLKPVMWKSHLTSVLLTSIKSHVIKAAFSYSIMTRMSYCLLGKHVKFVNVLKTFRGQCISDEKPS